MLPSAMAFDPFENEHDFRLEHQGFDPFDVEHDLRLDEHGLPDTRQFDEWFASEAHLQTRSPLSTMPMSAMMMPALSEREREDWEKEDMKTAAEELDTVIDSLQRDADRSNNPIAGAAVQELLDEVDQTLGTMDFRNLGQEVSNLVQGILGRVFSRTGTSRRRLEGKFGKLPRLDDIARSTGGGDFTGDFLGNLMDRFQPAGMPSIHGGLAGTGQFGAEDFIPGVTDAGFGFGVTDVGFGVTPDFDWTFGVSDPWGISDPFGGTEQVFDPGFGAEDVFVSAPSDPSGGFQFSDVTDVIRGLAGATIQVGRSLQAIGVIDPVLPPGYVTRAAPVQGQQARAIGRGWYQLPDGRRIGPDGKIYAAGTPITTTIRGTTAAAGGVTEWLPWIAVAGAGLFMMTRS